MAADLHIHIFEPPCTEEDLASFFRNTMGSKHFSWAFEPHDETKYTDPNSSWSRVANTPNVWVGEVSWLKAMLFEDGEDTYVPPPVALIHDFIGEDLPVLDDDLYTKIVGALETPNATTYDVADSDSSVATFLREHMGKRLFTVSW